MRSMTERGILSKTEKNILSNAKQLRKNLTPQEKKLWYGFLRQHEMKWYKQKVLDKYILDFYCPKIRLAIELDGSQHYFEEGLEYDKRRTKYINSRGIKVLRFINSDVDNNFGAVCEMINDFCKNPSQSATLTALP